MRWGGAGSLAATVFVDNRAVELIESGAVDNSTDEDDLPDANDSIELIDGPDAKSVNKKSSSSPIPSLDSASIG